MPGRSWSKGEVIDALRQRQAAGRPVNYTAVLADDEALTGAARRLFGGWPAALMAAGIDPVEVQREARSRARETARPPGYWTPEQVLLDIQAHAREGHDLSAHRMQLLDGGLVTTAQRLYSSWDAALRAAGYAPELIRRAGAWSGEEMIARLQELAAAGADLSDSTAQAWDPNLYTAARECYGSWPAALDAAGVAEQRRTVQWSQERVLEAIRDGWTGQMPSGLRRAAERYYGSVDEARAVAGADEAPSIETRLRERRAAAGLSQGQLGAMVGRSGRWVGLVEAGRIVPAIGLAIALARAVGATVEEIWEQTVFR